MRIRKQQLGFLDQRVARNYELRLTNFLQEQLPDATEEPVEKLRPAVAEQIEKARSYGLRTEQEVANYVIT